MKYLPQFKLLAKQLEANPKIEVKKFEARPKASAKTLATLAAAKGLSAEMLSLWSEANGIRLSWVASGVHGEIELLPIETVLGDWKDTVYFDFTPTARSSVGPRAR